MRRNDGRQDAWITFQHRIGFCGGKFDTRLASIEDKPEILSCPACTHTSKDGKLEAAQAFAAALKAYLDARDVLEKKFNLVVVELRD